jgi:hypothetical protein
MRNHRLIDGAISAFWLVMAVVLWSILPQKWQLIATSLCAVAGIRYLYFAVFSRKQPSKPRDRQ